MTYDEIVKKLGYATCTRTTSDPTVTRKEHKPMDFANAKIVVGNRVYPPKYVNFKTSPGEYPFIEVEADLDPRVAVPYSPNTNPLHITNVIFNPPATIVFWSDNTKTVVKAQEFYDPEKGIAMAISKKMLGDNKYEYYNMFRHWLKKWEKQPHSDFQKYIDEALDAAFDKYHEENFDKIHKGIPPKECDICREPEKI